jgi:predicted ATP-dependent protease
MHATLCFEQSYSKVDGDSASIAEVVALLSALSEIPVRQDLAITGSFNQFGQSQAIGAVNEKIEGFFSACKLHGLVGTQGVLIPEHNVSDLCLDPEVLAACEAGQFHVWSVQGVDDAVELLMGTALPAVLEKAGATLDRFQDVARLQGRREKEGKAR